VEKCQTNLPAKVPKDKTGDQIMDEEKKI
jgi:hypothetical protein